MLKGIEVDILEDGTLALPDALLRKLDVVVASVHDYFTLNRRQQTQRLLRALESSGAYGLNEWRTLEGRAPYETSFRNSIPPGLPCVA